MILIVGFQDEKHIIQVQKHLSKEPVLIDTSWFPNALRLNVRFDQTGECMRFSLPSGESIHLDDIGAIWYRRIKPLGLHEDLVDETAKIFAWSESNEALLGVWYSINCFWMNPPVGDEIAQRKIRQLQIAQQIGLPIPETLITNEPAVARAFLQLYGPGNVIRKAFRNIAQAPRTTSLVHEEDLAIIDSVQYAPVIFQKFVPAEFDLRITIVEDDIFTAAIYSESEYSVDYRLGLNSARVIPYQLPQEVETKLMELMKILNIHYGAIDMRVTSGGEHVFLEVNPAGEFLFISERTQQPIPAAIASSLERHDKGHYR